MKNARGWGKWLIVFLLFLATLPGERKDESPASLGEILRARSFQGLLLAGCFLQPLQYFYTTWMPRYFDEYAGVGFGGKLAMILVIVYLFLDLGFLSGGALALRLSRRMEVAQARRVIIGCGVLLMMVAPAAARLRDVNAITACICAATLGLGWVQVNFLTFTSEVSSARTSTATGVLGGAGAISGGLFMLLVGAVVELQCFLYELYTDEAAFDFHRRTKHFAEFNSVAQETTTGKRLETFLLS
jgi:hypothetical protein